MEYEVRPAPGAAYPPITQAEIAALDYNHPPDCFMTRGEFPVLNPGMLEDLWQRVVVKNRLFTRTEIWEKNGVQVKAVYEEVLL